MFCRVMTFMTPVASCVHVNVTKDMFHPSVLEWMMAVIFHSGGAPPFFRKDSVIVNRQHESIQGQLLTNLQGSMSILSSFLNSNMAPF